MAMNLPFGDFSSPRISIVSVLGSWQPVMSNTEKRANHIRLAILFLCIFIECVYC